MIDSKEKYQYYRKVDLIANRATTFKSKIYHFPQCHFLKLLRKTEYIYNVKLSNKPHNVYYKIIYYWYGFIKNRYGFKYGWTIGINAVGAGLYLPHIGTVIINSNAKLGENITINAGTVIGVNGIKGCPTIGNNVTINPNVVITNDIYIADDITIGANAFVNKSFEEKGITIAGVPAKKICEAYVNLPVCKATLEFNK